MNLLEGLLLNGVHGELTDIQGVVEGEMNLDNFDQLFNGLAGVELSPEELEAAMSQFIGEDGSLDVEELSHYLQQLGQKIATESAKTSAVVQETVNAEHGISVSGEQQASAKHIVNESGAEVESRMQLIQSQQSLNVEASVESSLDGGDNLKKQNQVIQQLTLKKEAVQQQQVALEQNPKSTPNLSSEKGETSLPRFSMDLPGEKVLQSIDLAKVAMADLTPGESQTTQQSSQVGQLTQVGTTQATTQTQPGFKAHQLSVNSPVNHSDWADGLGDKVVWLTNQPIKSAVVKLNPQELGPIDINVKVHQNEASIQFTSHNMAAKEAIEHAMPKLREMMLQQGLELTDVNVSTDSSQTKQQSEQPHQFGSQLNDRLDSNHQETELVSPVIAQKPQGLVDLFA